MEGLELDVGLENLEELGIVDSSTVEGDPGHAPRRREFRTTYMSEEEEAELREIYSRSIVQDFNDTYHLSNKEREEMEKTHEKLIKFRKLNKKTRKIDKYIEIQRAAYDALEDYAETNGVLDPEDFKKRFAKGEIVINGLSIFPINGKKERKKYNWDYIFEEYILRRDKDPKELLRNSDDEEEYDEEEIYEQNAARLFGSLENLEKYTEELSEEEKRYRERAIINEKEDGVVVSGNKKSRKKLLKLSPMLMSEIKHMDELERKNRQIRGANPSGGNYIYEDDLTSISEYDRERGGKYRNHDNDMPEFHGDFNSNKDIENYLLRLKEYELDNEFVEYNGKVYTERQYQELVLKEILDKNGWEIRNLAVNIREEKKRKKRDKKYKRKEEKLQSMLEKLQKKTGESSDEEKSIINTKRKKSISKKKKKKVKKKHKKVVKDVDNLLLDITSKNRKKYKKIKKYKKEMEDFRWQK